MRKAVTSVPSKNHAWARRRVGRRSRVERDGLDSACRYLLVVALGLIGPELEGRLGQPFMVRQESPAEIWQYRGETCVFDVFLYPEAAGRRVVYLEARDKAARPVAEQPCLSEILQGRAGGATS